MNKYHPHVLVLLEDDAYRQIANGFRLQIEKFGNLSQIMSLAKGWAKVRDKFSEQYEADMLKYSNRYMIMLVDADGRYDRRERIQTKISAVLIDRVLS